MLQPTCKATDPDSVPLQVSCFHGNGARVQAPPAMPFFSLHHRLPFACYPCLPLSHHTTSCLPHLPLSLPAVACFVHFTHACMQYMNEEASEQYDRQIRLWGEDAQKRMSGSRVLFSGINGVRRRNQNNPCLDVKLGLSPSTAAHKTSENRRTIERTNESPILSRPALCDLDPFCLSRRLMQPPFLPLINE